MTALCGCSGRGGTCSAWRGSAARLCMAAPEPDEALAWLMQLLRLERDWVPSGAGTSLYIRPVIMASEAFLGVRPSQTYTFFVILSPVGRYYESTAPMRLLVEDRYVRAVDGGVGAAKTGGNYAAALLAAEEAHAAGFDQVLWLDGRERRYIDEAGMMNVMVRIGDTVVTPPLTGTLLDGVTRDTSLTLLREWGVDVQERPVSIDEVASAARDGTLQEVWGTGTAAVVQPVGELSYRGERIVPATAPGETGVASAAGDYGPAVRAGRGYARVAGRGVERLTRAARILHCAPR